MTNAFKIDGRTVTLPDGRRMTYLTELPELDQPAGIVLVHNRVTPASPRPGARGSRWWTEAADGLSDNRKRCHCGVTTLTHYRPAPPREENHDYATAD